jgi:hypothetical protein
VHTPLQVVSKRVANAKSERYHGNILKRGKVELTKVSWSCGDMPRTAGKVTLMHAVPMAGDLSR